ncbi:hypothetical protein PG994_000992 [Apiospora phragmitis]|uniref:Uncharacterized protein n=1 Tax=Apiospora phragmitis TaxID=2905665 RepID=A0ABR1WRD3_9PEZI
MQFKSLNRSCRENPGLLCLSLSLPPHLGFREPGLHPLVKLRPDPRLDAPQARHQRVDRDHVLGRAEPDRPVDVDRVAAIIVAGNREEALAQGVHPLVPRGRPAAQPQQGSVVVPPPNRSGSRDRAGNRGVPQTFQPRLVHRPFSSPCSNKTVPDGPSDLVFVAQTHREHVVHLHSARAAAVHVGVDFAEMDAARGAPDPRLGGAGRRDGAGEVVVGDLGREEVLLRLGVERDGAGEGRPRVAPVRLRYGREHERDGVPP